MNWYSLTKENYEDEAFWNLAFPIYFNIQLKIVQKQPYVG